MSRRERNRDRQEDAHIHLVLDLCQIFLSQLRNPRYKTLASIFNEILMLLHLDTSAKLGPSGMDSQEGH